MSDMKAQAPTCFIAMPITTSAEVADRTGDPAHWDHVIDTLFVPAVIAAGFTPIKPTASGSQMIHANIIRHLETADMVLCDLSDHNPNVYFELGVRTSLDKPIALVAEDGTRLPFDIAGINTAFYNPALHGWQIPPTVAAIAAHIQSSVSASGGRNPLWEAFGLTIRATQPAGPGDPETDKLQLIMTQLAQLKSTVEATAQTPISAAAANRQSPLDLMATPANRVPPYEPKRLAGTGAITKITPTSANSPAVRAFAKEAAVFSTQDDRDIDWFQLDGVDGAVLVLDGDFQAVPLASRRALMEIAAARGIEILPIPASGGDGSSEPGG